MNREDLKLTPAMEDMLEEAVMLGAPNVALKGSTFKALERRGLAEVSDSPEGRIRVLTTGGREIAQAIRAERRPVHLIGGKRGTVCGTTSPIGVTGNRAEATCPTCKLEGEPEPKPEYRVHPAISEQDAVMSDPPLEITFDRIGRTKNVAVHVPAGVVRDGADAVSQYLAPRVGQYLVSSHYTVTVDLVEGVASIMAGRFGSGTFTPVVEAVIAEHSIQPGDVVVETGGSFPDRQRVVLEVESRGGVMCASVYALIGAGRIWIPVDRLTVVRSRKTRV